MLKNEPSTVKRQSRPKMATAAKHGQSQSTALKRSLKLIRDHGGMSARHLLSPAEIRLLNDAMNVAIDAVRSARRAGRRAPRSFNFHGCRLYLMCSNLDRVFICDKAGNRLVCSAIFAA